MGFAVSRGWCVQDSSQPPWLIGLIVATAAREVLGGLKRGRACTSARAGWREASASARAVLVRLML